MAITTEFGGLVKSPKMQFPSFRQKPESRLFSQLQTIWTPVFTGVTTFYEDIKFDFQA